MDNGSQEFSQRLLSEAAGVSQYAWPARWYYPSQPALPVNPTNAIPVPSGHDWTEIMSYTVPRGFEFVVEFHFHSYAADAAGVFYEGSGKVMWGLFANSGGSSGARAVEDFAAMLTTRGSPASGPWPLRTCLRFSEGTVLSYQVVNVSQTVNATSFTAAGLHGRLEPAQCGGGNAGAYGAGRCDT